MSDTPRTDAALSNAVDGAAYRWQSWKEHYRIASDFARQLERELREVQAQLARLEARLNDQAELLLEAESAPAPNSDHHRHADCQDECQTAAARGPAYACYRRRCDLLVCEEDDAKRAASPG